MDIDTAFKNANFTEETIVKMIEKIISIKLNDNAKISYLGISQIRDEDEYGGFRVDIQVEIDNIKEKFHVDIATGDPITPKEIKYRYKPILEERYLNIWAYNIETVLAEKIETVLSRLEFNGRMRDFYDIYLIYTKYWNDINLEHFIRAVEKTFSKREYVGDVLESLNIIMNSNILRDRWKNYQKKYEYAKGINFDEILKCLEVIVNIIIPEEVF